MSKKHPLLKTIITTAAALYATNEAIDYHAKEKNVCSSDKGLFYDWKYGQVYYTVQGEGEGYPHGGQCIREWSERR